MLFKLTDFINQICKNLRNIFFNFINILKYFLINLYQKRFNTFFDALKMFLIAFAFLIITHKFIDDALTFLIDTKMT